MEIQNLKRIPLTVAGFEDRGKQSRTKESGDFWKLQMTPEQETARIWEIPSYNHK